MAIDVDPSTAQAAAVDQARVIELVRIDGVGRTGERSDGPQVGEIPAGEEKRGLASFETGRWPALTRGGRGGWH